MNPLDELAEQRIRESRERGELDDLPGAGRPLDLDDDRHVPEHLRMAYRVLRNANCLPPELSAHAEIRRLEDLLAASELTPTPAERRQARRRLAALRQEVAVRRRNTPLWADPVYEEALLGRLDGDAASGDGDPDDPPTEETA